MNIEDLLKRRINLQEIKLIMAWVTRSNTRRAHLWQLAKSNERQTSVNALWVLTHLSATDSKWLGSLQDELIDMLLIENDRSKKRLLLKLLREQEFHPESLRTDLIDYCLSKINSECEAYATRAFCIYVAFKMCRHYPELAAELKEHLAVLSHQNLSPGLTCARRKTLAAIDKL